MKTALFAGGGTAGHINPLLATAEAVLEIDNSTKVIVLGTKQGLEARLVPERGFELVTIPRLPFPRRISLYALGFPFRLFAATRQVIRMIRSRDVEVVVGFGGYAAAPAYLAAIITKTPFVVHEANVLPGVANRIAARFTKFVATSFAETVLSNSKLVGMPIRKEISKINRAKNRVSAIKALGLDAKRPVLLVTGGSTGAAKLNATIANSASRIIESGWQILHTVGENREFEYPKLKNYFPIPYCDRMDLAYTVADFIVARSGAATVCELAAVGIPAVFVPYPVGNGEQELNARGAVAAGTAIVCPDVDFSPAWVEQNLVPLLTDKPRLIKMAKAASGGLSNAAVELAAIVFQASVGSHA